jgi:ribosomal 50S subunit-recycling heat shock protein
MKKLVIAVSAVLCLTGAHAVLADQHKAGGDPVKGEISHAVEMQATVTAIDQKTRMVTLKAPEGNETTLHVDKRARNLAQVKVGDVVKFAYVQEVTWQVRKPGEGAATSDVLTEGAAVRAPAGEKPSGGAGQRVTLAATIEAIDLGKGTVTLKGPQGDSETIKARNPANLKKVKVGDVVDITYTEAIALKVVPAPK